MGGLSGLLVLVVLALGMRVALSVLVLLAMSEALAILGALTV